LPAYEREFNETQVIYAIVELSSFRGMEVRIVFFMGVPNHVEVSKEQPGHVRGRSDIMEFMEVRRSLVRNSRSVDIGDCHREA
jgi:hypothetical protein